jgi:PadR family transcriptional regulator, regulatory protein PadR
MMEKMRPEALKGHLDALLLAVVAAGPAHGYRILEDLKRRSGGTFDLPEGTVYPALHRLERDGLLASRWTLSSGRRRRVYRITRRGRSALARQRGEWERFAGAVEAVLA